ncbi:hypothetical protein GGS24DRAFT_159026 [Hypoxylon argillaceum]|nr:hypothetical protein GGS24DRAFT_159026 [Hypoxylon argillaceum]
MPNKLREKAAKKVLGPDANPTQLGDPISLKAETSDYVPTEEEGGDGLPSPSPSAMSHGSKNETLREKAAKKLKGPDANPSQLGDPISLKNETSPGVPASSERGTESEEVIERDSKL